MKPMIDRRALPKIAVLFCFAAAIACGDQIEGAWAGGCTDGACMTSASEGSLLAEGGAAYHLDDAKSTDDCP